MKTTTEIELISIDALVPYANNARTHSPAQISKLRSSLREFGFVNPVLIDREKNVIAGHGRIEAAKAEGMTEVPCVYVDHLTEAQKKAYILADNRLALDAGWDDELLKIELDGLKELGFDVDLIGFDKDELDAPGKLAPEAVDGEDDVPEVQEDAVTKTGDVWILGEHRLLCGDATDARQVEKLMNGEEADAWITDPPYGVDYHGEAGSIENDNMADGEFEDFLGKAFSAALSATRGGGAFYVWHADSKGLIFRKALASAGATIRECLIWVKNSFVMGRQDYQWQHEPCLYGWKDGAAHYFIDRRDLSTVTEDDIDIQKMSLKELRQLCRDLLDSGKAKTTVIHEQKPTKSAEHPTMKPVRIFEAHVWNSTKRGDIVLDTFAGSGTTAIACEKNGRKARLMELDPHYCDVIVRRWQDFSGKEAVLEATGQTFEQVGSKSGNTKQARRPVKPGRKGVENG